MKKRLKSKRSVYVKGSKIHGRGGYAAREISKGERIITYSGRRFTKAQGERSGSDYVFELNARTDILGLNAARYINHSCEPNCESEIIRGKIWIIALRDIKKDEELTYNYCYDLRDAVDYPCSCGSRRCVGYMVNEDLWPKLGPYLKKLKKHSGHEHPHMHPHETHHR